MNQQEDRNDAQLLRALLGFDSELIGPWRPKQPPLWMSQYLSQSKDAAQLQGLLIETARRLQQLRPANGSDQGCCAEERKLAGD